MFVIINYRNGGFLCFFPMFFLIVVTIPIFVLVSIMLFIIDGILAKKRKRNRYNIFTNMCNISMSIIWLIIGVILGSIVLKIFSVDPQYMIIGIVLTLFAIISIILFIRDGILAKKEKRHRRNILTGMFIIGISIITTIIFCVSFDVIFKALFGDMFKEISRTGMGGM